jgi:hypothetical protein
MWERMMTDRPNREPAESAPPGRTLLTTRAEYAAAGDRLLAGVRRELRVFDPALTEFAMDAPARIELLRAFLLSSPQNRLYIAVHDAEHVQRYCARVMALLDRFSASMLIYRTEGDAAKVQDCFVLADESSFVRRPVWAQPRGVFITNDPLEAAGMRKRFDEIWASSVPGASATTTGL